MHRTKLGASKSTRFRKNNRNLKFQCKDLTLAKFSPSSSDYDISDVDEPNELKRKIPLKRRLFSSSTPHLTSTDRKAWTSCYSGFGDRLELSSSSSVSKSEPSQTVIDDLDEQEVPLQIDSTSSDDDNGEYSSKKSSFTQRINESTHKDSFSESCMLQVSSVPSPSIVREKVICVSSRNMLSVPQKEKLESQFVFEDLLPEKKESDDCYSEIDETDTEASPDPTLTKVLNNKNTSSACWENTPAQSEPLSISPPVTPPFAQKDNNTIKGSEWVQRIPWNLETPNKSAICESKEHTPDSTKKRFKTVSGGFAEQLQRLRAREKSARNIWLHQKNCQVYNATGKSASLQFEILHVESQIGLIMATCRNVLGTSKDKNVCEETENIDLIAQNDSNNVRSEEADSTDRFQKTLVLFPVQIFHQLTLSVGTVFMLHSPWQTLQVDAFPMPVILCPYFIEVVKHSSETATT